MAYFREKKLACLLICVGLAFIYGGMVRGEHSVVWRKAVHLCLECVGLG